MITIMLSRKLGELRVTQAELAEKTGIRPNTINDLFHNVAERVSLEHLAESVSYLYTMTSETQSSSASLARLIPACILASLMFSPIVLPLIVIVIVSPPCLLCNLQLTSIDITYPMCYNVVKFFNLAYIISHFNEIVKNKTSLKRDVCRQ